MRVKDIHSGGPSSWPYSLTAVGNTLYFAATDGINGIELWKSDGTDGGTVMVRDIYSGGPSSNPNYLSSNPNYLTAVGNTLYFRADDGINGTELWKSGTVRTELWKSDGTAASNTVSATPIDCERASG